MSGTRPKNPDLSEAIDIPSEELANMEQIAPLEEEEMLNQSLVPLTLGGETEMGMESTQAAEIIRSNDVYSLTSVDSEHVKVRNTSNNSQEELITGESLQKNNSNNGSQLEMSEIPSELTETDQLIDAQMMQQEENMMQQIPEDESINQPGEQKNNEKKDTESNQESPNDNNSPLQNLAAQISNTLMGSDEETPQTEETQLENQPDGAATPEDLDQMQAPEEMENMNEEVSQENENNESMVQDQTQPEGEETIDQTNVFKVQPEDEIKETDMNEMVQESNEDDVPTENEEVTEQIHADHDEDNDQVIIYSGEKQERPRTSLAQDVSVTQLPPLSTSPELDMELSMLLRNYERKNKLPDPTMRVKLVQYVQREKVNAIVQNKYDKAAKMQNLSVKLLTDMTVAENNQQFRDTVMTVEEKIEEVEQRIKLHEQETKKLIKEEEQRQKSRRISLKVNHNEELDAFEDHWNDTEFLHVFEKPSSYLLQLKRMERSMVLTKMFERAEVIKKKVAELEKEESALAQKRAYSEMQKQQRKITTRQQQELEVFDQHCNRNIEIIKRNQEIKLQSLIARKIKLEMELTDIKESRQNALPVIPTLPPTQDGTKETTMTPRTAQRYSSYKARVKQPQLTVKPLGNIVKKRRKVPQSAPATDL